MLVGWGTDEKAIISILGHRDATQRKLIKLAYEELYEENLMERLKSELSGDFEVCLSCFFLKLVYNSPLCAPHQILCECFRNYFVLESGDPMDTGSG